MARKLLLLSNSTLYGHSYLEHAREALAGHFAGIRKIAFVPFALNDREGYGKMVAGALSGLDLEVETVPRNGQGVETIRRAEGIFVGGGNTFRLLDGLRSTGVLDAIRQRAGEGVPYMGSSAGTVVSAPTIKTTNDMPIVQPESFEALGLVPFQINPHFIDADPSSEHMGETRELRLQEFLEENEGPVLAMREGAWLSVEEDRATLGGVNGALLFSRDGDPAPYDTGADLSFLLKA